MARRKTGKDRVLGPYPHGRKWRIFVVDSEGKRDRHDLPTEKEAREVARALRRELGIGDERTVDEAIDAYERHLKIDKGNKPVSVTETVRRMRVFFPDWDLPLHGLTSARAAGYYDALSKRTVVVGKGENAKERPISVDSHRNMLAEARSFLKWCVGKRWIKSNPLEHVQGRGRRRHGKPQLRIDEARLWLAQAVKVADEGETGAVAAMMSLLMGMRAHEITTRVVRDLDNEGKLLWIPETKTEAGRRTIEVPELLQPHLSRIAANRKPEELLFGKHWRDWPREWVQRICEKAGVMKVTAHGMRGLHSTLAIAAGVTGHVVAATLGHESPTTTLRSYVKPGAAQGAQQKIVLHVLEGGKSA